MELLSKGVKMTRYEKGKEAIEALKNLSQEAYVEGFIDEFTLALLYRSINLIQNTLALDEDEKE